MRNGHVPRNGNSGKPCSAGRIMVTCNDSKMTTSTGDITVFSYQTLSRGSSAFEALQEWKMPYDAGTLLLLVEGCQNFFDFVSSFFFTHFCNKTCM